MIDFLTCGKCLLPIHEGETGIRHFGAYKAHSEDRCIYLLQERIKQLTPSVCCQEYKNCTNQQCIPRLQFVINEAIEANENLVEEYVSVCVHSDRQAAKIASFTHVGYVNSLDGCTSTRYSKQLPEGKHWLFISPPPK